MPSSTQRSGRPKWVPAVGPKLQVLLAVVFVLVALLGVNSLYLASITGLEWLSQQRGDGVSYQNHFYLSMFLLHLALGLVFIVPYLVFGVIHMRNTFRRKNRRAVRIGYSLFFVGVAVLVTGVLLVQVEGVIELKQPAARSVVYWVHVICPIVAIWMYWLHRLVGRPINWRLGLGYGAAALAAVVAMVIYQTQDPREWGRTGPEEGLKYFQPSRAVTASGNFLRRESLVNDKYCLKCHADVHKSWSHSAHRHSSFSNAAYLSSILEVREMALKRDGNVKASRWCAGCHDPVPFFSGAFDDPNYDVLHDPTASAGITCTVCHAISNVNSTEGNGDYTIREPLHYPFASSENPLLQFINNQLVKAKPAFHKREMLKPFHKTAEFCSTCHKVHLPKELNDYKEFLRGQNHYDPYLLSGVSGHGARSFYYPPKAETNCNGCHMPLQESTDFAANDFDDSGQLSVHDHTFVGANTGVAWLNRDPATVDVHREFLEGSVRVDVFGIKEEGRIDGELHAPLRPDVPTVEPGKTYLLETVIRTLKVGHLFTQGTVDSNEVWLEARVSAGGQEIGHSGWIDERGEVDRWAHFVNVFMLDRHGLRINRRNAHDIFVPLYNNQIPPGAGQVVHYRLDVPPDVKDHLVVDLQLKYRKFDQEYMEIIADKARPGGRPIRGYREGAPYRNELPVTVLASDRVVLPVAGLRHPASLSPPRDIPDWERWNDYGIGLFLKGKAELRQAAEAFRQVKQLDQYHGPLNLARVYHREGRLDEAVIEINRAAQHNDPAAPPWTLSWLSGLVNREQGHLDEAARNFREVLDMNTEETRRRQFDFSLDYEVINLLGSTLFDQGTQMVGAARADQRKMFFEQAVEQFQRTLAIDSENVSAHYNLSLLYTRLGDEQKSEHHKRLHTIYKPDDNARDGAVSAARRRYPWADRYAEAVVINPLVPRRETARTPPDSPRDGDQP